ncbi:MAG: ABC transporter permease, partial [Nitratireductor sp.]|nr:ABC transporter permease [Nitratireductor sp.]
MENLGFFGVVLAIIARLWPVWIGLGLVYGLVWAYKPRLGLFGQLFNGWIGTVGVSICLFWVFAAMFADIIAPFGAREQIAIMKNAVPGNVEAESAMAFLLGGDHLARDVFSRVMYGCRVVLLIAPAATMIAFIVGITLGLPAGYFGGKIDSVLSFLANLVLAFPVIL